MQSGIESVAALATQATSPGPMQPDPLRGVTSTSTPGAFAGLMQQGLMQQGLGELNASVGAAENAMHALAAGQGVELHDVMISLERARISVQTFVQVRNKLVESYQDLMRMQL